MLVYVDDVEAHRDRAQKGGATMLSPIEDGPYGRLYRAEDLEGHRWMFMQRPCISGGWTEHLSRWAFFACVAVRWRLGSRVVVDATGLRRRSLSASTQLYKQAVIALPDC